MRIVGLFNLSSVRVVYFCACQLCGINGQRAWYEVGNFPHSMVEHMRTRMKHDIVLSAEVFRRRDTENLKNRSELRSIS